MHSPLTVYHGRRATRRNGRLSPCAQKQDCSIFSLTFFRLPKSSLAPSSSVSPFALVYGGRLTATMRFFSIALALALAPNVAAADAGCTIPWKNGILSLFPSWTTWSYNDGEASPFNRCGVGVRLGSPPPPSSLLPPPPLPPQRCEQCTPEVSTTSWTPVVDGTPCALGEGVCDNGQCRSGPPTPRSPDSPRRSK